MANKTSWVSSAVGVGLTWTLAGFTLSGFNSLAAANDVVAATAIANGTALDLYADVSFLFTMGGTTTANSRIDVYILPLNADGSTYGDGSASGSALPAVGYQVGSIGVRSGITSGNPISGVIRGIALPPGDFKFVVVNQTGVALNAAAAADVKYRTYNENLNAT